MNQESEGPSEREWDNYPLACRTRFLGLCSKAQTASRGVFVHFILPEIDALLDDYLAWCSIFDPRPEPSPAPE